jgi:hypothetical protein
MVAEHVAAAPAVWCRSPLSDKLGHLQVERDGEAAEGRPPRRQLAVLDLVDGGVVEADTGCECVDALAFGLSAVAGR